MNLPPLAILYRVNPTDQRVFPDFSHRRVPKTAPIFLPRNVFPMVSPSVCLFFQEASFHTDTFWETRWFPQTLFTRTPPNTGVSLITLVSQGVSSENMTGHWGRISKRVSWILESLLLILCIEVVILRTICGIYGCVLPQVFTSRRVKCRTGWNGRPGTESGWCLWRNCLELPRAGVEAMGSMNGAVLRQILIFWAWFLQIVLPTLSSGHWGTDYLI